MPDTTDKTSPADVAFVAMTAHHHRQGLAMAELAQGRAGSDAVRYAAAAMASKQAQELDQLDKLLAEFGAEPMSSADQVEAFNDLLMQHLQAAGGAQFDQAFLHAMALHHIDAVHQIDLFLIVGQDERARSLAQHSRQEQLDDLEQMQKLSEQPAT